MDTETASPGWEPEDTVEQLAQVRTRAEFGALLTRLRRRSRTTLRDVAAKVGSSASTLSGWCRAENLPFPSQYDVFRAMLRELGVENADPWIDALDRVRQELAPRQQIDRAPYRGLESFSTDDADRFFGRDTVVAEACRRLRERWTGGSDQPVVVLVGPSGAGKSSLLHAGIRPRLEADGIPVVAMSPGSQPLHRLVAILIDQLDLELDLDDTVQRLQRASDVWDVLETFAPRSCTPTVLLVDQIEELFVLCDDVDERQTFLAVLERLVHPQAPFGHAAVLCVRIDLYAALVATGSFSRALQEAQVLVGPLGQEQLRRAIVEPARQVGISVDEELVALVLRDLARTTVSEGAHDAGALPLLSHALLETWSRSRRGRMTVADYHASGGIDGAVEQSAEQAYGALSAVERDAARQLFLRLVRVEGDALATRRTASRAELEGIAMDAQPSIAGSGTGTASEGPPVGATVLERFIEARLLTAHARTVTITHEALLTAWPRLRRWIDDGREALLLHRRVAEATRLWLDSSRHPSTLARGPFLEVLRSSIDPTTQGLMLAAAEREFLEASIEHANASARVDRRRMVRLRALSLVAVASAALAGWLAVVADGARSAALEARDEAESRQIAGTVDRLTENDPLLAAQLAVVGYGIAPTTEARSALLDRATQPSGTRFVGGAGPTFLATSSDGDLLAISDATNAAVRLWTSESGQTWAEAASVPLSDSAAQSYAIALHPEAPLLAVGQTSAQVELWDVTDPHHPRQLGGPLSGLDGPIQGLAFDADGQRLTAVGEGAEAMRWDVQDPRSARKLIGLPVPSIGWSVATSPAAALTAVGDDTGTVTVWELSDERGEPRQRATLTVGTSSVLTVAFSADGRWLVAGDRAGQLRVWDVDDIDEPVGVELDDATLPSWANVAVFNEGGSLLAAGSADGTMRLWDTSTWSPVAAVPHPGPVTSLQFAGDTALFSAAADGTTRRWEISSLVRPALDGAIWSVGFSEDGRQLAAFSGAETGVWDLEAPSVVGDPTASLRPDDDGYAVSGGGGASPDGRLLAHAGTDGDVLLYDMSDPQHPTLTTPPLRAGSGVVEMVGFSADGQLMAAAGGDGHVRVWQVEDPERPELLARFDEPTEMVLNLSWSPNGRLLAAASADSHVYIYDLSDQAAPELLARLSGFDSEVYGTAFSPDGSLFAAAGTDAYILLWDLARADDPTRIGAPIRGPSGRVYDLAFDRAGLRLAAATLDGAVWAWDVSAPEAAARVAVLAGRSDPFFTVAFSPAEDLLAAAGADGRVHQWPLAEGTVVESICSAAGSDMTREEWEQFVPGDRPYTPPCRTPTSSD